MNRKKTRIIGEVVLVALMIGSIFLMGKIRMHQLHLGAFFPVGFGIILVLMIVFAVLVRITGNGEENPSGEQDKQKNQ